MADNCLPTDVNGGKIVPKLRAKKPVSVAPVPDDHLAAIRDDLLLVFAAYQRLKAHGWTDPHPWTDKEYNLLIIEPGSTGVHVGCCDGEEFGYWVCDECMWPSRPLLVKRLDKRELI